MRYVRICKKFGPKGPALLVNMGSTHAWRGGRVGSGFGWKRASPKQMYHKVELEALCHNM